MFITRITCVPVLRESVPDWVNLYVAVEGLMLLAPACLLWLGIGVMFMEWPTMLAEHALSLILAKPLLYATAGSMGFCVNMLSYLIIQKSSSLTMKVRC